METSIRTPVEETRAPGMVLDQDAPAGGARKPHVMVVGHLAGAQIFGAERSLLELLAAIDRRRYDVSCVLPARNCEYERAVAQHTKNITVFPYPWWTKARPFDEETVGRFEELIQRDRVDLVHVNTITIMDPLLAARRLGVPSIVHARELIDQDDDLARLFGADASAIVSAIRGAADFIIANSDATHRLYGKAEDRSFRLYNCVDVNRFDLPNHVKPGKVKVGIISNNQPKKGIEQFVRLATLAGSCRPELEFLVIGPRTGHVEALERRVREDGRAVDLRFSGYVEDPVEAIRRVNVVVSFSLVAESFGRTIAEALAARRPVIAYRWGAAPELIRHEKDGFLIPYLDYPRALEHLRVLADDPRRVLAMGNSGRERARQMFSHEVFGPPLNGIYRRVLYTWTAHADRPTVNQRVDLGRARRMCSRSSP